MKPRLDDVRPDVRAALVDDLHRIAFLAESLAEQRSRWKKTLPQADELLDREGRDVSPAPNDIDVHLHQKKIINPPRDTYS